MVQTDGTFPWRRGEPAPSPPPATLLRALVCALQWLFTLIVGVNRRWFFLFRARCVVGFWLAAPVFVLHGMLNPVKKKSQHPKSE